MVAIQRGTERPNDVVIITGHIDSRVTDLMDATADAPGANDDGSGTAAVIEAARVLSKHKFPGTIVYAALSGEEQGLLGGKILADYAKAQGWNVVANLNNDIIGNSCGSDGVCDDKHGARLFRRPALAGARGIAPRACAASAARMTRPSRNISRFLDTLAERLPAIGLDVTPDLAQRPLRPRRRPYRIPQRRLSRGALLGRGRELRLAAPGSAHRKRRRISATPSTRWISPICAKVTKLNVAALAALASAPPPPEPTVEGAVSTDTTVQLGAGRAARRAIVVRWRRTDSNQWETARRASAANERCQASGRRRSDARLLSANVLKGIRVDDWVFGVSSVSKDGFESPVALRRASPEAGAVHGRRMDRDGAVRTRSTIREDAILRAAR